MRGSKGDTKKRTSQKRIGKKRTSKFLPPYLDPKYHDEIIPQIALDYEFHVKNNFF